MSEIMLATNGCACLPIVVPPEADRVVRFAGRELHAYLERITGAAFEIGERPASKPSIRLAVGPVQGGAAVGLDAFRLDVDAGGLLISGVNGRSVLYGVYALLEDLGCRFAEPGIEAVPSLPTLSLPGRARQETSPFAVRNIFRNTCHADRTSPFRFLDPDVHLPQIDWMAKQRLNRYEFYVDYYRYDLWETHKASVLEALLDRGFDLEVTHHSLHYFCPPDENHDFGRFGPETYLVRHPDWYVPAYECGSRGRWQTRVELPAVREVVIRRYLEYGRRNPELLTIGLWPDDVPMNAPEPGATPADGYLPFWNEVAAALAAEHPAAQLAIIAYFELRRPPRRATPAPNTHCWFCPIERNWMYPVSDPHNHGILDDLKGWVERMPPGRVGIFEYYGWAMPLAPYREIIREDLQVYRDLGAGGVYGWSGFTRNILGHQYRLAPDYHALARLLWNPDADLRRLDTSWAQTVFGPAAGDVLAGYDLLAAAHARARREGLVGNAQWITLDLFHRLQPLLAQARRQADTPARARRIDLLEMTAAQGLIAEPWRDPAEIRDLSF